MTRLRAHVVFDLETNADRPDPSEHEIIQIGAVAASADGILDEFETLVRPQRKLPPRITELTGLEYGDLGRAPPLEDALSRFFEWVGDRPMVAHNGFGYDFVVLDSAVASLGLSAPEGPRLDTLELAHLVYSRAGEGMVRGADGELPPPGRKLDQLAERFGLGARGRHDALNDARIARQMMLRLLGELNTPSPARRLQRWILGCGNHPWAAFVEPQLSFVNLHEAVPEVSTPEPIRRPTGCLDVEAVVAAFREGGSLMTAGRTQRPQQAEMAEMVAEALGKPGRRLMIEAPTGTGKTLAYLVPAIEAARASGRVTVVAPHSRVLQDQILRTLEQLESVWPPFSTVVLKGRQNYISLKSLQSELEWLHNGPDRDRDPGRNRQDADAAMALAILCGWVSQTPSGDWADLRTAAVDAHLPNLRFLRWRLRVDSRPGPLHDPLDRLDFYRRALDRLKTAHVAVLNHALLAADSVFEAGEFNLIVDEAHDLEDSVTAAATRTVDVHQLEFLCDALWDPRTRRGLVRRINSAGPIPDELIARARATAAAARSAIAALTEPLIEYVRDRTGATRDQAAQHGASHRIVRGADQHRPSYRLVQQAGRTLRDALRDVADALDDIDIPDQPPHRHLRNTLEDEKARLGRESRNAADLIDAVLWAEPQLRLIDDDIGEGAAQWVNIAEVTFDADTGTSRFDDGRPRKDGRSEKDGTDAGSGRWRWALRRAPLSVAGLLVDLWSRSGSTVLTSATLQAGGNFSYLQGRLGLEGAEAKQVPSPLSNLAERHLVLLTDYLPAPRGQLIDRFTEVEASEIPRLCVAAGGGAMALMTARARLSYVRDHARQHLAPLGIKLLAQGDGPSGSLIAEMQQDRAACLLGLRSFWEGVDVPGEALRLLIIEKIPFDPIGDPLVSARMDLLEMHGRDPFTEYLVPRAAIAFAQGTGRLIRTQTDIGATVVLDNRMRRPLPYTDTLRRSLAGPPTIRGADSADSTYRMVAEHLGLDFDDERRERVGRIPGVGTLSRAALNVGDPDAPLDDAEIERRLEIAKAWLGFEEWRPGQAEVMRRFMRGEDVVAVLPTGSGKSVTYQIPALVSPGVTLVVSPLIALMRDQVDNLRARGVSEVAAIHSGVGQAEQQAVLQSAADGHIKLLYVSPERLWSPTFRAWVADVEVARIAVDEAHCLSLWGHSFRPEYAMIPEAVAEASQIRRLPVAAVTATATPKVLDDIASLLRIRSQRGPLRGSVDRPEIRYYVERCQNRKDRDLRVVQVVEAFRRRSAIVYVPTRDDTVRLAGLLRAFGHRVRPYSGAMEQGERQHTEDAFRHDEIDVVVATKAFGLGIDKPDIELIVHLEMPASVEEFVQETGRLARGARDGIGPKTGTAVLLVTPRDCAIHKHFVRSSAPDAEIVQQVWSGLSTGMNFIDPAQLATTSNYGERGEAGALALHYLRQAGVVRRHRDYVQRGRVAAVDSAARRLDELQADVPDLAGRARRILETAETEAGEYDGPKWESLLGMRLREVEETLFELQRRDVCAFTSWRSGWVFERLHGAEPDWDRIRGMIEEHRRSVEERAQKARHFARCCPACRRREMLRYLGEPSPPGGEYSACGACDGCTPELPRPWQDSDIVVESAVEAVRQEAEAVALILIDTVGRGSWSRRNAERTLLGRGAGKYSLPERLRSHACYGRLALLQESEVRQLIDGLIESGFVEEVDQTSPEGGTYRTTRLTDDGRETLNGRYPR